MRTRTVAALAALILFLGVGPLSAEEDEDAPHPDDVALIELLAPLLPPTGPIAVFEEALADEYGHEGEETRDLGFGSSLRRHERGAEEVMLWIDVVVHEGHIVEVRIRTDDAPPAWTRLACERWGAGTTIHEESVEYRHVNAERRARMDRARHAVLGRPAKTPVPKGVEAAVRLLTDPLADLDFGEICYEDGTPPTGRSEASALWLTGSPDLLVGILQGPSPEGRMYAADVLLRLEEEGEVLGAAHREVLDAVLALPNAIRRCAGCSVFDVSAREAIDAARANRAIACRIIERLHTGAAWKDVGEVRIYWGGTYVRLAEGDATPGRRGLIPEDVQYDLYDAMRAGDGFPVRLGTPTYVRHLDDQKSAPPVALAALFALLDAVPEEGSSLR